jgi:hypothetical protein
VAGGGWGGLKHRASAHHPGECKQSQDVPLRWVCPCRRGRTLRMRGHSTAWVASDAYLEGRGTHLEQLVLEGRGEAVKPEVSQHEHDAVEAGVCASMLGLDAASHKEEGAAQGDDGSISVVFHACRGSVHMCAYGYVWEVWRLTG